VDPAKARDRSKKVGNNYCTNCAFRPESGKSVQICFLHVCVISVRWRAAYALAGPGKARACCALTRDGSAWPVITGPVLRVARARWWRVVASVVAPLVALSGGVGGPGGGHAVATRLPCLPVWMRAVLLARPYGPDRRPRRRGPRGEHPGRPDSPIRRTPRGVRWLCRCGPCSIRALVRPLVARLHSCRSPLALCSCPGHAALRCVTAGLGSSWAVGRVVQGG